MTDYVLVHGGLHAGWCWELMMPYLEEDPRVGQVVALDLVGHGSRLSDKPHDQITLEDYINDITGAIQERDLREVVIVGHSMAGAIIPQAAARVPDRVRQLVFVSASIPPNGKSILETSKEMGLSAGSIGPDPQSYFRHVFCSDMNETKVQWVLSKLGPEPLGALTIPVNRSGLPQSISQTYVLLTIDQCLPLEVQRSFANNAGDPELVELESGHDAMVSHTKELAEVLLRYA